MADEDCKRELTAIFSADASGLSRLFGADEASTAPTIKALPQNYKWPGHLVGDIKTVYGVRFPAEIQNKESTLKLDDGLNLDHLKPKTKDGLK